MRRMQVELTEMAPSGEAVGRAGNLVVFVRYGLPGEIVEVEVTQRRKNYARGRVAQVIRASPNRVQPKCPHFGVCGGCEWQHAGYDAQVAFKTRIVSEQLTRIGKFVSPEVLPCLPSPKAYGYRNHSQIAFDPDGAPGYYLAGSRHVMPVVTCPILDEALEDLLQSLRAARIHPPDSLREAHLRAGVTTGERMTVFEFEEGNVAQLARLLSGLTQPGVATAVSTADGRSAIVAGEPFLHERLGGVTYAYSPATFFQVNTPMAELLVANVLRALELTGAENVLDLYCGAGLFTLPASDRAGFVLGIESNPGAVEDVHRNLHGRATADAITSSVSRGLLDRRVRERQWQRIVLDPPRAGVDVDALAGIAGLRAPRVVYVSCDPATLARDARRLCDRGYALRYAQPLDLFPQTHHVETVAVFDLV